MKKSHLTLALLGLSSFSPIFAQDLPVGGHLAARHRPQVTVAAKPEVKTQVEKTQAAEKSLFMRTLPSACWLRSQPDANGNYVYGSGLVLDVDRRLVVTTSGVMTNLDKVIVDLPVFDGDDV